MLLHAVCKHFQIAGGCENFPQTHQMRENFPGAQTFPLSIADEIFLPLYVTCSPRLYTFPSTFFSSQHGLPHQTSISSHIMLNFPYCPLLSQSMIKVSFLLEKWIKLKDPFLHYQILHVQGGLRFTNTQHSMVL